MTRMEKDSFGEIEVPADKLWGAQTQRSLQNFNISYEQMPADFIRCYLMLKKACVKANLKAKVLDESKAKYIIQACETLMVEEKYENFPLVIWQTGSGTQTNMNVNEVIANKASLLMNNSIGLNRIIHPNDDVNKKPIIK